MTDNLERQLQTLLDAPPPVARDPSFDARVMQRIARIKRLRFLVQAGAIVGAGALALLITTPALQAADAVNAFATTFVAALDPLLISPLGWTLGLLAASAAVLHVTTD